MLQENAHESFGGPRYLFYEATTAIEAGATLWTSYGPNYWRDGGVDETLGSDDEKVDDVGGDDNDGDESEVDENEDDDNEGVVTPIIVVSDNEGDDEDDDDDHYKHIPPHLRPGMDTKHVDQEDEDDFFEPQPSKQSKRTRKQNKLPSDSDDEPIIHRPPASKRTTTPTQSTHPNLIHDHGVTPSINLLVNQVKRLNHNQPHRLHAIPHHPASPSSPQSSMQMQHRQRFPS